MRAKLSSGLHLNYEAAGAGAPVLLLHPIAMRAAFWAPVAADLARDHRVISVDTRGHGDSDPAKAAFSLDDLAGDVIDLIGRLDAAPAAVVGCSMGGMIAAGVAVNAPQAVSALVIANAAHAFDDKGRAVMAERANESAKGLDRLVAPTLERWFTPDFRAAQPETVQRVGEWFRANDPQLVAWSWQAIAGLAYEPALARVSQPVLALAGALDPAAPPAVMRAAAAAFPNGRYAEMRGAGHFAAIEQPAAVAGIIRDFIKEAAQPASALADTKQAG